MDGRQPPEGGYIIFGFVEGVYGPQNTPILWQYIITEKRGALRAIHTLNNPQNYTRLLGGWSAIHSMRRRGAQGLIWGARGPFLPGVAMVVVVVMPVVFVLRLLKNTIKILKLVVCKQKKSFYYYYCKTYYNSRNANFSMAGAQTSLVHWKPGMSGVTRKLLTSPRWLRHHVWTAT
jgi:hypothetical protein